MLEEQIAGIPRRPPRQVSDLPGLKWTSISSRTGLAFPIALVIFFCLFPLIVLYSEPSARLMDNS